MPPPKGAVARHHLPHVSGSRLSRLAAWNAYVLNTLNPLGYYKTNESSGVAIVNSGSGGAGLNLTWTPGTGALAQTSVLGPATTIRFDSANSRLQIANNPSYANLVTFEMVFLVNPTSGGEGAGTGTFFSWGEGAADSTHFASLNAADLSTLTARVYNTTPTAFTTSTTTGLTVGVPALIYIAYDDAGDRLIHIRKGVGGTVTEYGYGSQPALTGTFRAPTFTLNFGNNNSQTRTWDGPFGPIVVSAAVLTAGQRSQLCTLAGT